MKIQLEIINLEGPDGFVSWYDNDHDQKYLTREEVILKFSKKVEEKLESGKLELFTGVSYKRYYEGENDVYFRLADYNVKNDTHYITYRFETIC